MLQAENCSQNTEVSVLLTGDETIKILNGQYRGIDETTDVLSFSQHETDEVFPGADDENLLGDIVISVETARRQAEARGFTMDEEIEILLVHGLLHLLGYDHSEPDQAEEMFARQAELLA
ncbi:MAG: rRNA maturation RNase YbeY [Armatimonadota bacterium]